MTRMTETMNRGKLICGLGHVSHTFSYFFGKSQSRASPVCRDSQRMEISFNQINKVYSKERPIKYIQDRRKKVDYRQ